MNFKNRLKSHALWLSIIAFIPMLLDSFGYKVLPANYEEVAKAFLAILVLLGIVNNPDSNNPGYGDDK